ncbi:SET domain-containing protein [Obba rivulosa]|uniref:SET domain-containing protein n=1 Tax=Obba rivulosa TaxID=1052685 RepID=A0A8E2AQN6_9APHY|nr:SET domain-containing protein [Obba rivulosa]
MPPFASASEIVRKRKHGGTALLTPPSQTSKPAGKKYKLWDVVLLPKALIVVTLLACGIYLYSISSIHHSYSTNSVPFRIVELLGKGKGVIATRDIRQGEIILREKPLFVVPSSITSSPGALLLDLLSGLTDKQEASYYDLSYVNLPQGLHPGTRAYDEALTLAIFQTNAVSAGQNVGIFPRMARLNHGCSSAFNAVYTWREREGAIVVHALKPIKEGEELLTTYTDTKRPRDARRQFLQQHYGFHCGCAVCSLPTDLSEVSDKRLSAISELYQRFSAWQYGQVSGREAEAVANEIWAIGEEEGYWSERGRLAADVAWVAAAHSDAAAETAWARLALRWYSYELGADSEQAEEMRKIVARPEAHPAWSSRHSESLEGPWQRPAGDV